MRKVVAIIVVVCLLSSGAWASFQAAAVRQIVSRGVTKICAPIPANDNRCLRLVTAGSDVLSTAANAATAMVGGPTSWMLLLANYLLTGAGGDYLFELGQKIRLWLTKDDQGEVVVATEEKEEASVPVVEVTMQSFTDPDYNISGYGTSPSSYDEIQTAPVSTDSVSIGGVSHTVSNDDPQTTGSYSDTLGLKYLWGCCTYVNYAGPYFFTLKDAQEYVMAKWYNKAYSDFTLQLYDLEQKTLVTSPKSTAFYWGTKIKPFWMSFNAGRSKKFSGYLVKVFYLPEGASEWQSGWMYFYFQRQGEWSIDYDCSGYINTKGACADLAADIRSFQADYTSTANINQIAADKLNGTTIKALNQPLDEYLQGLDAKTLEEELPAQFIADAVNKIYKDATSAENYDGLPYDESKRLTAADVKKLAPKLPTVGDARETIVDTSGSSGVRPGTGLKTDTSTGSLGTTTTPSTGEIKDPFGNSMPNIDAGKVEGTGNSTGTIKDGNIDVDVNVNLDLGQYPEASEPQLEPVEASAILQPIFDLFPALQDYSVPDHESECYRPTFELWGKEYVIESHCDLLEQHRDLLKSVCSVLWAIAALFVFLKA